MTRISNNLASLAAAGLIAALLAVIAASCQRPAPPHRVLSQEEWRRVVPHILEELPRVDRPVDAVFDERIRLIGWNVQPEQPLSGTDAELTLYWEVLAAPRREWTRTLRIASEPPIRIDAAPVGGLFPIIMWQRDQILRDRMTFRVPPSPTGQPLPIHLSLDTTDERMPPGRLGDGRLADDGSLIIGHLSSTWPTRVYEVPAVPRAPELSGRVTDPIWRDIPPSEPLSAVEDGAPLDERWQTSFRMAHDGHALFVAIEGLDPDIWATLEERDGRLWEEEVFELFIAPAQAGGGYIEFQINPLGTTLEAWFPSADERNLEQALEFQIDGLVTRHHVVGNPSRRDTLDVGWSAELSIPLRSIPNLDLDDLDAGLELRANVYRYERPADTDIPILMAWSPTGARDFHVPERFGTLRLEPPLPVESTTNAGETSTEQSDDPTAEPPREPSIPSGNTDSSDASRSPDVSD